MKYRFIETQLYMLYIKFCRKIHCWRCGQEPVDGTMYLWCGCGKRYPKLEEKRN